MSLPLKQSFEGRRTDDLPQAGNLSEARGWQSLVLASQVMIMLLMMMMAVIITLILVIQDTHKFSQQIFDNVDNRGRKSLVLASQVATMMINKVLMMMMMVLEIMMTILIFEQADLIAQED